MSEKIYRIGEAAALLDLKAYVLRFWETEFPQLVPVRTDKGQRLYSEGNIALLRRIKYLLHEQGLTIEGARRLLASATKDNGQIQAQGAAFPAPPAAQSQLPSGPELGYSAPETAVPPESAPGAASGPAAELSARNGEFAAIDPAVLAEVIDGLEEVRRMLLPR